MKFKPPPPFPIHGRCLVIAVALHANGPSSYRDATHIVDLSSKKWPGSQHVISDKKGVGLYVSTKTELLGTISHIVRTTPDHDILFTLSSHGYTNAKDQFVRIGRDVVLDHELRAALYSEMQDDVLSLCLIDTCHSGTMLDLPFISTDGVIFQKDRLAAPCVLKPFSFCISACGDRELAGEDISDFYGFGGKLSSQFLDYLYYREDVNIQEFYCKVLGIFSGQKYQSTHPVLSRF